MSTQNPNAGYTLDQLEKMVKDANTAITGFPTALNILLEALKASEANNAQLKSDLDAANALNTEKDETAKRRLAENRDLTEKLEKVSKIAEARLDVIRGVNERSSSAIPKPPAEVVTNDDGKGDKVHVAEFVDQA